MKKQFGRALLMIGLLMIVSAAVLWFYNYMEAKHAGAVTDAVMTEMDSRLKTQEPNDFPADFGLHEPTMTIDGKTYIGYISFPAVDVTLPVLAAYHYDDLKLAPCRYYGTVAGNDLVICAHNYRTHFGRLLNMKTGETVFFTDAEGVTTEYTVVAVDVLQPQAIEEMESGEYDLSVFTCTYDGYSRYTLRCDKVRP